MSARFKTQWARVIFASAVMLLLGATSAHAAVCPKESEKPKSVGGKAGEPQQQLCEPCHVYQVIIPASGATQIRTLETEDPRYPSGIVWYQGVYQGEDQGERKQWFYRLCGKNAPMVEDAAAGAYEDAQAAARQHEELVRKITEDMTPEPPPQTSALSRQPNIPGESAAEETSPPSAENQPQSDPRGASSRIEDMAHGQQKSLVEILDGMRESAPQLSPDTRSEWRKLFDTIAPPHTAEEKQQQLEYLRDGTFWARKDAARAGKEYTAVPAPPPTPTFSQWITGVWDAAINAIRRIGTGK